MEEKVNDEITVEQYLKIAEREKILKQYVREKTAAVFQRQRFATAWANNEQLVSGTPTTTLITKSNLHVPKVFEAVYTGSARMGRLPEINYEIKDNEDDNAQDIMKHLFMDDAKVSGLAKIFRDTKVECGIYGRGIIKLIPSNSGCKFRFTDTLSFLISPIADSIKNARNCGEQFIYTTMDEIEDEADEMGYDWDEINRMKQDKAATDRTGRNGNNSDQSIRQLRNMYLGLSDTSVLGVDVVEKTEWYTWLKLEKDKPAEQYVLTVADDIYLLRKEKFSKVGIKRNPYSSYATYPRGVAFWVTSIADIHRDPNFATDVVINQMIDNNTYRNFGQIVVDGRSGINQSTVTPRPQGVVKVNTSNGKVKDTVMQLVPPEITQSINIAQYVNGIADNASGLSNVPAGKKGKTSVTEIATNNAVIEEKSNDWKESINECFEDLAAMYAECITMNLTTPRKIKIYGQQELTLDGVTKNNFKDKDGKEYEFIAKAETAENATEAKALQQKAAESAFTLMKDDPLVPNQKYLRENLAKKFGFTEEQIGELMTAPAQPNPVNGTDPNAAEGGSPSTIPTGNPANPAGAELSKTASVAQANTIRQ